MFKKLIGLISIFVLLVAQLNVLKLSILVVKENICLSQIECDIESSNETELDDNELDNFIKNEITMLVSVIATKNITFTADSKIIIKAILINHPPPKC